MIKKSWTVNLSSKVRKVIDGRQKKKALPKYVQSALMALMKEIECFGPNLGPNSKNWPHFGSLGDGIYHCHLLKSKAEENRSSKKEKGPCYVACWHLEDKIIKIVEVYYVGSHEKAPY